MTIHITATEERVETRGCSISGCDRRASCRGMCGTHYWRWRNGRDLGAPVNTQGEPIIVRLVRRTEFPPGVEGCWLWTGHCSVGGYGQIRVGDAKVPVHRVAYEALVEPIPDGLHIDHLCRVRSCLNPDHLEPVTPRVNALRGVSPTAVNATKTACLRGHPLSGSNLYTYPDGRRTCRECTRANKRAYYARKKGQNS